jgi:uncharacterized protein YlzI (FlbEa/FlbD family)
VSPLQKEKMMIHIVDEQGNEYYLNPQWIEYILVLPGNRSEIRLITGNKIITKEEAREISLSIAISKI